jgi:hypothetical protein
VTSALGRAWDLNTKVYFEFGAGEQAVRLNAASFWDVVRAQTLSQEHEQFTYVFEGPDAEEASERIEEFLEGPVPTMEDVCYGVSMWWRGPARGGGHPMYGHPMRSPPPHEIRRGGQWT